MKVALVHDDLVQNGGAERVFVEISKVFPEADIFVSLISPFWKSNLKGRRIKTSFLQNFYLKFGFYKSLLPLFPIAFESFNLDSYDLVLSTSARFSHGVITKPHTTHIAYIHSPMRYLWINREKFSFFRNLILFPILSYLRLWDYCAGARPDFILANSKSPKERVLKFWRRYSDVLYPFVDDVYFKEDLSQNEGSHFLVISRLVYWKNIELVLEAFRDLDEKLIIVGDGPQLKKLKSLASSNVEFVGFASEERKIDYIKGSKALIIPQEEDFGIISLESQALGRPVIALGYGGSKETVIEGVTGEFFYDEESKSIVEKVRNFSSKKYDPQKCRSNASLFSRLRFRKNLLEKVNKFNAEKFPKNYVYV